MGEAIWLCILWLAHSLRCGGSCIAGTQPSAGSAFPCAQGNRIAGKEDTAICVVPAGCATWARTRLLIEVVIEAVRGDKSYTPSPWRGVAPPSSSPCRPTARWPFWGGGCISHLLVKTGRRRDARGRDRGHEAGLGQLLEASFRGARTTPQDPDQEARRAS